MDINQIQVNEYIISLDLNNNSTYYKAFTELTSISNSLFTEILTLLINNDIDFDRIVSLPVIDEDSINGVIADFELNLEDSISKRKEVIDFLNSSENYPLILNQFINGNFDLEEVVESDFSKYIAISNITPDSFITQIQIDEISSSSLIKFKSYNDVLEEYNSIMNLDFDGMVYNTNFTNHILTAEYPDLVAESNLIRSELGYYLETTYSQSILRTNKFSLDITKGIFEYGSYKVLEDTFNNFCNQVISEMEISDDSILEISWRILEENMVSDTSPWSTIPVNDNFIDIYWTKQLMLLSLPMLSCFNNKRGYDSEEYINELKEELKELKGFLTLFKNLSKHTSNVLATNILE